MTTPTPADDEKRPTQDVPTDTAAESTTSTVEAADSAPAPDESVVALDEPELPTPPPAPVTAPAAAAVTPATAPAAPAASAAPTTTPAAGQHAAPRPYPPVPPTSARGVTTEAESLLPPMPTAAPTTPGGAAAPAPTPLVAAPTPPSDTPAAATVVTDRPATPDLPRRPGLKRHLIGVLLGLLVTPVGLVLAAMGVGHMVDLPAGDGALTDAFGLVQLATGGLILGLVAVLGRWSAAVPITAGVLWGLGGGGVALWDPQGVHDAVHQVTDGRFAEIAINHILDPALNGSLLVLGLVLLGSGIAAGLARGAGRSFGARTVQAEVARAEAERPAIPRTS